MKTLIIFLVLSSLSFGKESVSFKYIRGKVLVNKKLVESKNAIINKPYIVETGKNGLAIIKIGTNLTFKLNKNSKIDLSQSLTESKTPEVKLLTGSLFSKIKKGFQKKDTFRLKVRSTTMGVRGTIFFTSFGTKKDDIWMCVNEGVVAVKQDLESSKEVLVKAGQGVKIINKTSISKPVQLQWTKNLNWEMENNNKNLENKLDIEQAYTDLLDHDYE